MSDTAGLHTGLAERINTIDWDLSHQFILLGDLASVLPSLPDFPVPPSLVKLGLIKARLNRSTASPPPSLHVYLSLSVSDASTELDISGPELLEFYRHFFQTGGVSEKNMKYFLSQHVTVMVVRHIFYKSDRFRMEIVGALSFSRPTDCVPTYLAYVAVSDGRNDKLPSISDRKPHVLSPDSFPSGSKLLGYRGQGLGSLLLFLMEHIVLSSIRKETAPSARRVPFPECFLHYNANNENSGDGWLSLGYLPVFPPTDTPNDQTAFVRDRYDCLALALLRFKVFKASHHDQANCSLMYTRFGLDSQHQSCSVPSPTIDSNAWYLDYASVLDFNFVAKHPSVPVYSLDVNEIEAKYGGKGNHPRSADLSHIIEMAYARKTFCLSHDKHDDVYELSDEDDEADVLLQNKEKDKNTNKTWRLHSIFSDQEFIDYACVQDPSRSLSVEPTSLTKNGREQLISVHVSSYLLPKTATLESVHFNQKRLKSNTCVVRCDWGWLRRVVEPEVASILEEQIMGLPVVHGIGLDHIDPCVAQRDVKTMASFHGVHKRVSGFISPPASHIQVSLPMNDFFGVKASSASTEQLIEHPKKSKNFAKHVKVLKINQPPPPLPRSRYQISRLKWIPTDDPTASKTMKLDLGYFQGAYCVPGTSYFSLVSLRDEWVYHQFEPKFLEAVKEQGLGGLKNAVDLIPVPPGDAKEQDVPSDELVYFMRATKFLQKGASTCLLDAFCSAMHEFGCVRQVEELRKNPLRNEVSAANKNIWGDLVRLVNLQFSCVGIKLFKQKGSKSVQDLLSLNDEFVIVASLKASDASDGQHAIAIFSGGIFDANFKYVLKKSQESLDWCCGGDGVTCTGVQRSFIALPSRYMKLSAESRYVFQARNESDYLVRGWVCSDNDGLVPTLQFSDGTKRKATLLEHTKIRTHGGFM
jgi:hypothetical protein